MSTENSLLRYLKTADIRIEKVYFLLRREAKINASTYEEDLSTALLYAARNPSVDYKVIKLLLREGANANARDFNDGLCTPLIYAAKNPNMSYKGIKALLKHGAVVDASNCIDGKSTALSYAARNPNPSLEVVEVLLRNGAYVHSRNYKDGQCVPLLYALRNTNYNYDVIKCLLENGANVHSANLHDGNYNALIYGVRKRDIDPALLELLLHHVEDCHAAIRSGSPCMPCLQVLKYIVLDRVQKKPSCIKGSLTCRSVLGDFYFELLYRHFPRYNFARYLNECVLEITQMKADGIYPIFSPSSIKELSFAESRAIVRRLISIWASTSCYPLYEIVIQNDMKMKDILNLLPTFQISTRCDREGTQRASSLDFDSTLLILEYITLKDLLLLLEAFYCLVSDEPLSPCKKIKYY